MKNTLRSRCIIGVWQWCKRDTASHMSQNIRSTSRSVKPTEMRSFICAITEPAQDNHPLTLTLDYTTRMQAWAHEIFIFRTEKNLKFQDIFQDIRVTTRKPS